MMKLDRKTKKALAIVVGFIGILILMPMMIMSFASTVDTPSFVGVSFDFLSGDVDDVLEEAPNNFYITVYRTETSEFQEIEFERYLIGVVAAEMPALFELDALRAQAIAARTYAMRILAHDDYILDTVMHQVFLDDDQLRDRWGDAFDVHFATIEEAVTSTQGIVITHEGELITPMFFAMSNGATENSEDVFPSERPYLRSVASSGYEDHDRFAVEEGFSIENLRAAFGDDNITIDNIIILEESAGGNVAQVQVGSEIFTGRDVREILGLRSASFSVAEAPGGILFTTYGNGHGVGMSQHGANVMAQNGADYREILQHFYQDVELVEVFLTNDE